MHDNVIQGPWSELSTEMDHLLSDSSVNATIGAMAFPVPDQIALLAVYWKRLTGQEVPYHFEGDINALMSQGAESVMFRRAIENGAARVSVSDQRRWHYVCELVRKMLDTVPLTEFEARSMGSRAHQTADGLRDGLVEVEPLTILERVKAYLWGAE